MYKGRKFTCAVARGLQDPACARGQGAHTMYAGDVLDEDPPVYPGPARATSLGLGPQAYGLPPPPPGPPQYPDFTRYSRGARPSLRRRTNKPQPPAWPCWHSGPLRTSAQCPRPPGPDPGLLAQPLGCPGTPSSPRVQSRTPCEGMRCSLAARGGVGSGKTWTKDKYRVVCTDHHCQELEKEFHYSPAVTSPCGRNQSWPPTWGLLNAKGSSGSNVGGQRSAKSTRSSSSHPCQPMMSPPLQLGRPWGACAPAPPASWSPPPQKCLSRRSTCRSSLTSLVGWGPWGLRCWECGSCWGPGGLV